MSAKDVQDLLRLLTSGRNKLTLPAAMARVKALQGADLRSISSIANADLSTITQALSDDKVAKSLQIACKNTLKTPTDKKRSATTDLAHLAPSKRGRSAYEITSEPQTPEEIEAALALPQPSDDEEAISRTTIYTNRAPLVLAFAVQLLKHTMPEQPLSSRLSLSQAVVSVNSSAKARSLGIEKGATAEQTGWGAGQPKVRVLGREIHVLKRGGYEWRGEEGAKEEVIGNEERVPTSASTEGTYTQASQEPVSVSSTEVPKWSTSASVTSRKSTFVARCIAITTASQARSALQNLFATEPTLRTADHNITAWRLPTSNGNVIEECSDDGESGGGRHVLSLLQSSAIVGVLVVVTRWYGGIMLGPDRWRIMTQVCRDALSQRLRVSGAIGQEALWGLDLEAMRRTDAPVTGGKMASMPIYSAESAKAYIMKAFSSPPSSLGLIGIREDEISTVEAKKEKKKSGAAVDRERVENLGLLLGALDMLFASWAEHISRDELDRRAWSWYVQVRPEVDNGIGGWGGKANVRLADILALRRKG